MGGLYDAATLHALYAMCIDDPYKGAAVPEQVRPIRGNCCRYVVGAADPWQVRPLRPSFLEPAIYSSALAGGRTKTRICMRRSAVRARARFMQPAVGAEVRQGIWVLSRCAAEGGERESSWEPAFADRLVAKSRPAPPCGRNRRRRGLQMLVGGGGGGRAKMRICIRRSAVRPRARFMQPAVGAEVRQAIWVLPPTCREGCKLWTSTDQYQAP